MTTHCMTLVPPSPLRRTEALFTLSVSWSSARLHVTRQAVVVLLSHS